MSIRDSTLGRHRCYTAGPRTSAPPGSPTGRRRLVCSTCAGPRACQPGCRHSGAAVPRAPIGDPGSAPRRPPEGLGRVGHLREGHAPSSPFCGAASSTTACPVCRPRRGLASTQPLLVNFAERHWLSYAWVRAVVRATIYKNTSNIKYYGGPWLHHRKINNLIRILRRESSQKSKSGKTMGR
jgi:hypothetical protein